MPRENILNLNEIAPNDFWINETSKLPLNKDLLPNESAPQGIKDYGTCRIIEVVKINGKISVDGSGCPIVKVRTQHSGDRELSASYFIDKPKPGLPVRN